MGYISIPDLGSIIGNIALVSIEEFEPVDSTSSLPDWLGWGNRSECRDSIVGSWEIVFSLMSYDDGSFPLRQSDPIFGRALRSFSQVFAGIH